MEVHADRVSLAGPHGTLLPPTSLTVRGHELAVVHGDPGPGLTAFGLALCGRLRADAGTVTADGTPDAALLRRSGAIVDAPGVTEPDGALTVRTVVGEGRALARTPARQADVTAWLVDHDLTVHDDTRIENLPPTVRTRMLTALAVRAGLRLLVLDQPDRHTADVDSWLTLAAQHAQRGLAVVVLSGTTPVSTLPAPPARLGGHAQPEPLRYGPAEVTETAEISEEVEQ